MNTTDETRRSRAVRLSQTQESQRHNSDSGRGNEVVHARKLSRILVAERDSMTADLLANALEREGACQAVAVRPNELLSYLATHPTHLLVMGTDRDSNGENAFELIRAVAHAHPEVHTVVILNRSTREAVIEAFRCGARGIVTREQPIATFLGCIEQVRRGLIWAAGREAEFLLDAVRSIPASTIVVADGANPLTDREMQVVEYAAAGKTNKVIAAELRLSEHTVKNYLFRAFEKLGISSRMELLFYLTVKGHKFGPSKIVDIDSGSKAPQLKLRMSGATVLGERDTTGGA